jgi:hypothetical protein
LGRDPDEPQSEAIATEWKPCARVCGSAARAVRLRPLTRMLSVTLRIANWNSDCSSQKIFLCVNPRSFFGESNMKKLLVAIALTTLIVPSAFAGQLIVNGGFETGSLSPWFNARNFCSGNCAAWSVTNTNPHSGTFSAVDVGNIELRQNFTATLGSSVTDISFWVDSQAGINAFDLFYTDGTDDEFVASSTSNVWTFEDVTSFVDTSKTLMGFSIFGVSPGFTTYVDDVSITAGTSVPEPGSLLLLGGGILAVASSLRRRLRF